MNITITCNATEYIILSNLKEKGHLSKKFIDDQKEVAGQLVYHTTLKLEKWRLLSFCELGDKMLVENIPLKNVKLVYREDMYEPPAVVTKLPLEVLQDVIEEHFDKGIPTDESILLEVHKLETRRVLMSSYDSLKKNTIHIEGLEALFKNCELNSRTTIQFDNGLLPPSDVKYSKLKFKVNGEEVKLLRELTTRKGYPIYLHEGKLNTAPISGVSFEKYGEE